MSTNANTPWFASRTGIAFTVGLRVLAVVDALAIPVWIAWWFWNQPKHGSFFGTATVGIVGYWGVKRALRAIFAFEEYDWLVLKAASIIAGLLLFHYILVGWDWLRATF